MRRQWKPGRDWQEMLSRNGRVGTSTARGSLRDVWDELSRMVMLEIKMCEINMCEIKMCEIEMPEIKMCEIKMSEMKCLRYYEDWRGWWCLRWRWLRYNVDDGVACSKNTLNSQSGERLKWGEDVVWKTGKLVVVQRSDHWISWLTYWSQPWWIKTYNKIKLIWSLKRFFGRQLILFLLSNLKQNSLSSKWG